MSLAKLEWPVEVTGAVSGAPESCDAVPGWGSTLTPRHRGPFPTKLPHDGFTFVSQILQALPHLKDFMWTLPLPGRSPRQREHVCPFLSVMCTVTVTTLKGSPVWSSRRALPAPFHLSAQPRGMCTPPPQGHQSPLRETAAPQSTSLASFPSDPGTEQPARAEQGLSRRQPPAR